MRSITAGVSLGSTSSAPRFSSTWDTREAPVMTVETRGLRAHQAIASCASVQPRSFATPSSCATTSFFALSVRPCTRNCMRGMAPRLPAGMPLRYLPVRSPEASGLHVVSPIPMSSYSRAYSFSTRVRWKRLYSGCSTTGLRSP